MRAADELCRRCGTEQSVPRLPQVAGSVQRALAGGGAEPFSLPWLLLGVLAYLALLFLGFQLFRDAFAEFIPTLQNLQAAATEEEAKAALIANADTLGDLLLKFFVLVGASYLTGGILLGRLARGRVLLQAIVAAGLSWGVLSMRASVLPTGGSMLFQLVIGGLAVVAIAAAGAWFGRWLRPKV